MIAPGAADSTVRARWPARVRWRAAAAAALLALLCVEAALRLVGGVFHDNFMRPDPYRGWSLEPAFGGWVMDERTLWIRTNRDGMRDRERDLVARPGVRRVALIGDSYVQGMNVPLEHTLAAFLETALDRCTPAAPRGVEVLNFGVSGYGTAQELLTLRHHAAKYRPSIVLLAFYAGNDVFDNVRRLNPTSNPERSPYFVLDGDTLVADERFRAVLAADALQPWWRRARLAATERSRVARLVYDAWARARPRLLGEPAVEETPPAVDEDTLEAELYRSAHGPEVEEAWRVTEALLLRMRDEARALGAELWIATLATARQIAPDLAARRAFARAVGVDTLYYPDMRVREFAERHGIGIIVLAPLLADYASTHGRFLNGGYNSRAPFGQGHFNEVGNRVAADLVAERLCPAIK